MKQIKIIITILLTFFKFSNCIFAQDSIAINALEKPDNKITEEQLNLIYESNNVFPNNTQLSIGLIKNNEVYFYGIERNNDTLKTIDNHQSVFEIGSVTKVFTATLLANYVVVNKINLDDNITNNLDYKLATEANISWLNLANHTAALPRMPSNFSIFTSDPQNPYKNYDEKKLVEFLTEKMKLKKEPGEKYEYSNLSAGLLGYLLSNQYQATFDELLNQHIFSKYEMNNSTTIRADVEKQLVLGLNAEGKPTPNWDLNVLEGAGAILSTVEDLSKFVIAHFNDADPVLELTRKSTFTVDDNMDIGLGWHILKKENRNNLYWHNGGTGGYTSSIAIDPKAKNGVIILSNVSAYHSKTTNIDLLCFELMKTLNIE